MGPKKGEDISKPHISLFTDSSDPSGVGEHMLILASELKNKYRISFVCPPTPLGLPFLRRAQALGVSTLGITAEYNTPALEDLLAWLRRQQVDIFHCHAGITWEGFGGVEAARGADVPVVLRTEHLPYLLTHPVQQEDHRRTVGLVDRLICVSESSCASFLKVGVPPEKLRAVPNGIPIAGVGPQRSSAVREGLGLSTRDLLVTTIGRLAPQKNHQLLIQAIPHVLERHPNAHFVWVGHGDLRDDLVEQLRAAHLTSRVHLLSKHSNIIQLLAASDLFVLPSLFEGLPLSVLEAMSVNLPVVGTRVPGISDAVVDGVTGRLVRPDDPCALANAIVEVLGDPKMAARWGRSARLRVEREFSVARMVRELDAIYRELLYHPLSLTSGASLHAGLDQIQAVS